MLSSILSWDFVKAENLNFNVEVAILHKPIVMHAFKHAYRYNLETSFSIRNLNFNVYYYKSVRSIHLRNIFEITIVYGRTLWVRTLLV